jgi:hypothetical protein
VKARDWFNIIVPIAVVGYFIYKVSFNFYIDHVLEDNPQIVKAVIINEKNYMGNSPVSHQFSYSYSFAIKGKQYTGNAHNSDLGVGDSVEVEYNENDPAINRPRHPKD